MACITFHYVLTRLGRFDMEKRPTFYEVTEHNEEQIFFRNFLCPDYDTCLLNSAHLDLLLDCSGCPNREIVDNEKLFA